MKYLLFLVLITTAANAYAQCDQFDNLLKKGDAYLKSKKPNYQEAINAYTAAILACSDRASEAQKRIAKMVSDINKLKENALAAERKATAAQKETEAALARSDSLYAVADAEKKRAEAVLDKIYFYNDRFGLASILHTDTVVTFNPDTYVEIVALVRGDIRFGFIDKNLQTKIAFSYLEALPFDNTGYAKVKKDDNRYYLIDTAGTELLLATDVDQLTSEVTALDVRNKNLVEIPDTVFSYKQLKVLLLKGNQLDSLPQKIEQLQLLQSLDLSNNQLSSLPPEIGQLQLLPSLDLSSNKLSALPAEIGQLQLLQLLDLSSNRLSALPAEVVELKNLQTLGLNGNDSLSLASVCMAFRDFPKPIMLSTYEYESNNDKDKLLIEVSKQTSLPAEIGQLKNLQSLYLSGSIFGANQLSRLPAEIGQLKNLRSLYLAYNQLRSLPAEISQLGNLQSLDLDDNQLSSLPAEVGELKNLQWLFFSGNQLSSLPAEVGQLKNLQRLDLSFNRLSSLPAQIRSLKSLKRLDLKYNSFSASYIVQLRKDMPWCEIRF